jgi:hypothetical protein
MLLPHVRSLLLNDVHFEAQAVAAPTLRCESPLKGWLRRGWLSWRAQGAAAMFSAADKCL